MYISPITCENQFQLHSYINTAQKHSDGPLGRLHTWLWRLRSSRLDQASIKLSMVIHWAPAVANWILQTLAWLMVGCHKCGAAFLGCKQNIALHFLYVKCLSLLVKQDFSTRTQSSSLSSVSLRAQGRAGLYCMRRNINAHNNLSIKDNAGKK